MLPAKQGIPPTPWKNRPLHKENRGVLTCGEHANINQLNNVQKKNPLNFDPKAFASTPQFFPGGFLNKLTVKAFNEAWYRKAPLDKKGEIQDITQFFYPLDGIMDWNRIYGPRGFIQYQFAVPDENAYLVKKSLSDLKKIGAPIFLTVLKRFGAKTPSPLSFPIPGWTLAIDIPSSVKGLRETLDKLDEEVIKCSGKVYLAKDSRLSKVNFEKMYPLFEEFKKIYINESPFMSDLFKRFI